MSTEYCTAEDIARAVSVAELKRLLNFTGAGDEYLTDSRLLDAIETANGEVDSYVRKQMAAPLITVPGWLRQTAAQLSVLTLKEFCFQGKLSDPDKDLRERIDEKLTKVARSEILIQFETRSQVNASDPGMTVKRQQEPKLFGSEELRNW
jgi:phage gp36-like protein